MANLTLKRAIKQASNLDKEIRELTEEIRIKRNRLQMLKSFLYDKTTRRENCTL